MRRVKTIEDLKIPKSYKQFILGFLERAKQQPTYERISTFVLFGSCAREKVENNSDVDIMVLGDSIGDETLFDMYDCTWWSEMVEEGCGVNCDVFVNSNDFFEQQVQVPGSLQWRIDKDGVLLNLF